MKHKKLLGIPVIGIIAVILSMALTAVGVSALWSFHQTNNATVRVMASNLALFKDTGCTQPLLVSDSLAFGDVRVSTPSSIITLYEKNTGDDPVRSTLTVSGLASNLVLTEGTYGVIGTATKLYQSLSTTFTPGGVTNSVSGIDLTAAATEISMLTGSGVTPTSGFVKIDNEIIQFAATQDISGYKLLSCVRGYGGTTAAIHTIGATITFGTTATQPGVLLQPGAVQPIALTITATQGVTSGVKPFSIVLDAETGF